MGEKKESGVYESFGLFNFTWVQNKKNLNMKVRVSNSNGKRYF